MTTMKTFNSIRPIRTATQTQPPPGTKPNGCLRLFLPVALGMAIWFQSFENAVAGAREKPSKQENGSVEVRITGDLHSLPDHTSNGDNVWPATYDLCRNVNLTIAGGASLGLPKVRMFLPFPPTPEYCGYDGPKFDVRGLILRFGSNPAFPPADVTLEIPLAKNFVISVQGQLKYGQWPPEPDGSFTVEIGKDAFWTYKSFGGWPKSCGRIEPFTGYQVTIVGTRNDNGHTTDPCDCPVDYAENPGNFDDSCDPEPDVSPDGLRDGLVGDNCPFVYNPDQADTDGDGVGDACENEN